MIYIEPTPYVTGLIREVAGATQRPIDFRLVTRSHSQEWGELDVLDESKFLGPSVLAAVKRLSENLGRGEFTILHLAGWGHPVLLVAIVLARLFRVPVVVESDTQLPFEIPLWKRVLKRLIMPVLFRLPSGFLPGGTRQVNYLRHYRVPEDKIQVAQMTVDVEAMMEFSEDFDAEQRATFRESQGIGSDQTVFLYVGRMEPHKGVRELLAAFAKLHTLDSTCHLLLAGGGTLASEVTEAVKHSLAATYPGRLSGAELLAAYNASDVFVLPSTFEPWGLVVNEAMAAGLAVIASNRVGCVDDLVIHGKTGWVYDLQKKGGLLEAMKEMAADKRTRVLMGRAGQRLISRWTLHAEARRVIDMWEQVA